ncbi:MAG: ferredoxin [Verrucomicrobiales bacterium]|nr:ferredoxin [Verrucomicrobiales bacterium]
MARYEDRFPDNAPGNLYVDGQCIDCDLCRDRLPEIFHRNERDAHSYVSHQPDSAEEWESCRQAIDDCPVEAIGRNEF